MIDGVNFIEGRNVGAGLNGTVLYTEFMNHDPRMWEWDWDIKLHISGLIKTVLKEHPDQSVI